MSTPFLRERLVVVLHILTTGDEHQVCVSREVAEIIEFAWIVIDAKNLKELERNTVLIRPVRTPITDLCSMIFVATVLTS